MPDQRSAIIGKIITKSLKQLPKKHHAAMQVFVRGYYAHVALQDLESRSIGCLSGIVVGLWRLGLRRSKQQFNLKIYNPSLKRDQWQTRQTVIQLNCKDMPFIVASLCVEISRQRLTNYFLVNLGGIEVVRDDQNVITAMFPAGSESQGAAPEAFVHIEINRLIDRQTIKALRADLLRILKDIDLAVTDWQKMHQKMSDTLVELTALGGKLFDMGDVDESKAFLAWLLEGNFTFLGYRRYEASGKGKEKGLRLIKNSGQGVFRHRANSKEMRYYAELPVEARKLALSRQVLTIAKTNTESTVHRRAHTDYISVKRFDKKGNIIGEHRFIGLFTSDAYDSNPVRIPVLRRKLETVIKASGLSRSGHAAKRLMHILRTLPRDDLFQATAEELFELSMGILQLQERQEIRLFVRRDAYRHFVSCLVYVPREKFNTDLRRRMQGILMDAFHGLEADFTPYFSESLLAVVHYIIRITPDKALRYDVKAIEEELIATARSWRDDLSDALINEFGEDEGHRLLNEYQDAFPGGYRESFPATSAVRDILRIKEALSKDSLVTTFYRKNTASARTVSMKLFHPNEMVLLSQVMPILENMALNVLGEHSYCIVLPNEQQVWISHFSMQASRDIDMALVKNNLQETFLNAWFGHIENDRFNVLVLNAGLTSRDIVIFRAYAKYLRQAGLPFSQQYVEHALNQYPDIAHNLVSLFKLRFSPGNRRGAISKSQHMAKALYASLDHVKNLDVDRILRRFIDLVMATLRTNYFQHLPSGGTKSVISFKFDPNRVPGLPLPVPKYECFVYSPAFEGIHLRAGQIARGGIRWSDRREDFRTEVLGLMKAQQVKNSVIVPSGAKGGFVLKRDMHGASRDQVIKEAVRCYQAFIGGLLDVTDNLVGNKVAKPKDTVCYDKDDAYLVVAADKGTATFSDIANAIAQDREFWLGDAFASGGSAGYDHKKMGITARGVWESVKRHFYELGADIDKVDFTVVGIGDMSGDVFGNGMMLSKRIKLVAAFNHMHIFLDPDPDPLKSFAERRRLFNLPRSTWEDYDVSLISKGGGVYSRAAKSIQLSEQVKKLLNLRRDTLEPSALIQALLRAPVDLLWNGGIGTYIKASTERHQDVGDWSNDALRVNANELCCRMIGEGGNLGVTQLGRVEYELHGGRINTDFIDNVSGVDCSDHEVNSKILLNQLVQAGKMSLKQRNSWLVRMTNEVAALVLHNNYRQNLLLGLAMSQLPAYLNLYERYMDDIERAGQLSRALEFLPDSNTMRQRKLAGGKGLTRSELSVLLSYSKGLLKQEILETDLLEDAYLDKYVQAAFPAPLAKRFANEIKAHRLRREIGVTQMSDAIVNDMGIVFIHQMQDELGASIPAIVRAYLITREIFGMDEIWKRLCDLENKISASMQIEMMLETVRLVRRATRWFLLDYRGTANIETAVKRFSKSVMRLKQILPSLLSGTEVGYLNAREKSLIANGIPADLANKIARMRAVYPTLNIIQIAGDHHLDLLKVAKVYFKLAERLQLPWLRDQVNAYPVDTRWSVLARSAFRADLDRYQRGLTVCITKLKGSFSKEVDRIEHWVEQHRPVLKRWQSMLADLRSQGQPDFMMFTVLMRELYELTIAGDRIQS